MTEQEMLTLLRERMSVYNDSVRTRTIIKWAEEEATRRYRDLGSWRSRRNTLALVDDVLFEASFKF